jgi:transcriptional regulator with XRE-family HTH domain
MDVRRDIHDFLVSRRARITPAQAGLPTFGDRRRVAGLRREEVAALAGVSVDYYARLERGNLRGVSESVLDALARALQLDDTERGHLFDLARAANATSSNDSARQPRAPRTASRIRPSVHGVLAGLAIPAYVRDTELNILAANELCVALYGDILTAERLPLNLARFVFLDSRATELFVDWSTIADDIVASLRREVGRDPVSRSLSDLVGELTTRSDEFSLRWARHDVRVHRSADKTLHNAIVGDIDLTGDALELGGDGLVIIAYTAKPDSRAAEQLAFLASWAANQSHARTATDTPIDQHTD